MSAFMEQPYHALRLGSLNLIGENERDGVAFTVEAHGNDMTWGNPQPIVQSIESYIAQGLLARVRRWEDREAFLTVTIAGTDSAMEVAEAALEAECNRPNELSWRPPGEFSHVTVFDVRYAAIEHVMDDIGELRRERTYGIRFVNHPHARSDTNVIVDVPAPSVLGSATLVDDASSVAGWTLLDPKASISTFPDSLRFLLPGEKGNSGLRAHKDYSQAWAEDDLLRIAWSGSNAEVTVTAGPTGTTPLDLVAQDGRTRWFARPDGVTEIGRLKFYIVRPQTKLDMKMYLREVAFTDVSYVPETGRTSQRSISVQGSAPTEASLDIGSSAGLGEVVAFTYSGLGDYSPRLSSYEVVGTSNSDSTTVSGFELNLGASGGATYSIPATSLPSGTYHALARLRGHSSGRTAITWTMTVGDAVQSGVTYPVLSGNQRVVSLESITTPAQTAADSESTITLQLEGDAWLDETWLLHPQGALTWVRAGDGKALRIVSPSLDHPRPAVYVDGIGANALALGRHRWEPGEVSLDLMTEVVGAWTSLDYTPRWHTHAGAFRP